MSDEADPIADLATLVTDWYLCGGPALDWTTFLSWGPTHRAVAKEIHAVVRREAARELAFLVGVALGGDRAALADALGGREGAKLNDRAVLHDAAAEVLGGGAPEPPRAETVTARMMARNESFGP